MTLDGIGERIHDLRIGKRMSQIALVQQLGVSQETISAYENQRAYPSAIGIKQMCEIFSVSSDYLLGISTSKTSIEDADLNANEVYLLSSYRKLSIKGKMIVDNDVSFLLKINDMD